MEDQTIETDRVTTPPPVSGNEFRRLMAGFPTGVTVVTAVDQKGNPAGMTCSSLCSVSLEPPMLLLCLRRDSPTLSSMLVSSVFTVNFLHARGQAAAELFASRAPDRFTRINWYTSTGRGGPRLPDDAHSIADCRIRRATPAGDHVVVIGEVFDVSLLTEHATQPLLHGLRRYVRWPSRDSEDVG